MTTRQPRHPIAIIGGGIAGLAAAHRLREKDIPFFILERFPQPGGRLNSRTGDGWIADHGARYVHLKDETILTLMRSLGFERRRVAIQGPVYRLTAEGRIDIPDDGGVDAGRLCIDTGFATMNRELAEELGNFRGGSAVGAIRWDNNRKVFWWEEGSCFWFEDEAGNPLRDPVTREVTKASGVILATTATAATRIAMKSASLDGLVPLLSSVAYNSTYVGIFRIPRLQTPFFALEGEPGSRISWLSFEERKAPERADPNFSILVVHANPVWSESLMGLPEADALRHIYEEARRCLPQLPESPLTQTYKRWQVANLETEPIGFPGAEEGGRWKTKPRSLPFSLAGDYVLGPRAEDAARSGVLAAEMVLAQLPLRRTVLGLELPV